MNLCGTGQTPPGQVPRQPWQAGTDFCRRSEHRLFGHHQIADRQVVGLALRQLFRGVVEKRRKGGSIVFADGRTGGS